MVPYKQGVLDVVLVGFQVRTEEKRTLSCAVIVSHTLNTVPLYVFTILLYTTKIIKCSIRNIRFYISIHMPNIKKCGDMPSNNTPSNIINLSIQTYVYTCICLIVCFFCFNRNSRTIGNHRKIKNTSLFLLHVYGKIIIKMRVSFVFCSTHF